MPEVAFVVSPDQNAYLRELAETLSYELELQGVPATIHREGFPEPRADLVYVLMAPLEYAALRGSGGLPDDAVLKRTIFISAHRPEAIIGDDHARLLTKAGAVFDIDVRSVLAMRRAGVPARSLRPGYSALRDHFDPEASRSIDVLFAGAHSPRRTRALARLAPVLARHNCLIQVADGNFTNPTGSASYLAGTSKWELLAHTRLLVNLHRDDEPYLEWLRVMEGMHTGAVVVSEHASGLAPLVPGEHLMVGDIEALPHLIDRLLHDPDRLERLRTQAYERLRSWLPFAMSVAVLRTAVVEVVGYPLPPGVSLGARVHRAATEVPGRWNPPTEPADDDVTKLQAAVDDARADVIGMRRELVRLERLSLGRSGSPAVEVDFTTPAWHARRASRVSVVTTAGDDPERLETTLESVRGSWTRDFELLVVVESGGEDLATARRWLRREPRLAARIVTLAVDEGRGGTRNLALQFARAPYVLMLEAGCELYPRALSVAVGTLDAMPDVAFAYPIQEVCGADEAFVAAGGDYVASYFGWEPSRLRFGNYIESPVLIRTDRLREIGGYTTDPVLEGWEDFDLWCRMAERGWTGQLVPQILARRPAHRSRAASTVAPGSRPAMSALVRRAPRLLRGLASP